MKGLREGHLQGQALTVAAEPGDGAAADVAAAAGFGNAVAATAVVNGSVAWFAISVARAGMGCHGATHPLWG